MNDDDDEDENNPPDPRWYHEGVFRDSKQRFVGAYYTNADGYWYYFNHDSHKKFSANSREEAISLIEAGPPVGGDG